MARGHWLGSWASLSCTTPPYHASEPGVRYDFVSHVAFGDVRWPNVSIWIYVLLARRAAISCCIPNVHNGACTYPLVLATKVLGHNQITIFQRSSDAGRRIRTVRPVRRVRCAVSLALLLSARTLAHHRYQNGTYPPSDMYILTWVDQRPT
ncbi:uncharacterized protein C8Q71DRAFT_781793 [Rhodofomes roseus]|uniref:Uncharacterized protein n=1 Tax=Rhodofomes roseus TaxID=34475 RepID=A0ABQ8K417_9APHY|nr:uncharacterized protein C8Q71DRAFT_781793 [Rhodofomes roseus]KAH9831648.1 hypothetical protein C8Q71DRAFT_781793 [Rhodofomes roseus]